MLLLISYSLFFIFYDLTRRHKTGRKINTGNYFCKEALQNTSHQSFHRRFGIGFSAAAFSQAFFMAYSS